MRDNVFKIHRLKAQRRLMTAIEEFDHQRPANSRARRGETKDYVGAAFFWALALGVALAPAITFGSNRAVAWAFNGVYFALLALLHEAWLLLSNRDRPIALTQPLLRIPLIGAVIVIVWSMFQISPWAPEAWRHPIWSLAAEALSQNVQGYVSVNPDDGAYALLRFLSCLFALYLAMQLCAVKGRGRSFLYWLSFVGTLYAIYGLATVFSANSATGFSELRATFMNRNSYATYAGLGFLCVLSVISDYFGSVASEDNFEHALYRFVTLASSAGALWLFAFCVITSALLMTGSRGGISATLFAFLFFIALKMIRTRSSGQVSASQTIMALIPFSILAAVIFFVLSINGGLFLTRIQSLSDEVRLAVYTLTSKSLFDAPLLGYGDGTFSSVLKMYRDATLPPPFFWDKAHNSYLEVFQGLGLIVGAALMVSFLSLFICVTSAAISKVEGAALPLTASAACVLVGVHALVDFSMQIEAIALTWAALVGAGLSRSLTISASNEASEPRRRRRSSYSHY